MDIIRRESDRSLPLMGRLYASRGADPGGADAAPPLCEILPAGEGQMRGLDTAARIVADGVSGNQKIVIIGDYDADGGGGSAVAMMGLLALGAQAPAFLIPDRIRMGYGLSPALADQAKELGGEILVTVDNGIAAHDGVRRARSHGMAVVVTDHHLAPEVLPDADAIVNPNQPGCPFPSKALSGCGVMLYLLIRVRELLNQAGWFERMGITPPNLGTLCDVVALSTVGDMVPLDRNNRILVAHGLRRIRAGRARPGVNALLAIAKADPRFATANDFGFRCAPRINAAGRLEHMGTGVACLMAADEDTAYRYACDLDRINEERKALQRDMTEQAHVQLEDVACADGVVVYDSSWHEGVVGLVATKVRDAHYRPAVAFADADDGSLKGSGRSISGLHLRDLLAAMAMEPDSPILRMGGHAMAAGLSIRGDGLNAFTSAFARLCGEWMTDKDRRQLVMTDGELTPDEISLTNAAAIESGGPWGRGFDEPLFEGRFRVTGVRMMGGAGEHARYQLDAGGAQVEAVHFFCGDEPATLGHELNVTYRLDVNRWRGKQRLQLRVEDVL